MQEPKRLNLFTRILMTVLMVIVAATVIGRNHFFLGTTLILFRWIFITLALVGLWFAFRRSSQKILKIGLIAIVCLLLLEFVWCKYWQKKLTRSQTATEVSLMTYNIFFRNFRLDVTLDNIKKYNPDILAVQELTPSLKTKLEGALDSKYHYKELLPMGGTQGIGIYSKYRIVSSRFLMNAHNHPFAQIVEIDVGSKKIQVFNVHLASPALAVENPDSFWTLYNFNYTQRADQLKQIEQVVKFTEKNYNLQLMVGDLNTTQYEPLYRNIRNNWVNLYDLAGSGLGFNFPNSSKIPTVVTLDYMFGRGAVSVVELKVVEGGGSDHLAVVGKIRI